MTRVLATPPKFTQFGAVGSKLAGATIALMLLVTIGVYLGLSRYQRENQLRAKEMTASALVRLFADSCSAPIVFEDDSALHAALDTLGRNEEVEYAAVWLVEPAETVGKRLAELSRGRSQDVTSVPKGVQFQRQTDRIIIVSPIRDEEAVVVGVTTVALSLARENRAAEEVGRRTLAISSALALGLTLLLMAMVRFVIVRPLSKLVLAAKTLEQGGDVVLDVNTNDEVGQLAFAFRNMADAIALREERITARNRDMRLVLDNVGQGFVTLDGDGCMSEERSRIISEWFGPAQSLSFGEYLKQINVPVALWFELGWEAIREDVLPLELCLQQLPRSVSHGESTFELAYCPVMKLDRLNKLVVVVTDVTARIAREQAEQMQRETLSIFRHILSDRVAFEGFFTEASGLVDAIVSSGDSDLVLLRRQVHTLKGNCAWFDIESVVNMCHAIEDRLDEVLSTISDQEKTALRALWTRINDVRLQLTGGAASRGVQLAQDEYEAFLADLRRRLDYGLLVETCLSWQFEPASKRLVTLGEQVQRTALRLGKAQVQAVCLPTTLRLPPAQWNSFWSLFAHVIRNTADHGVQTLEERRLAGKPEQASVTFGLQREGERVVLSVQDDGPGVDWAKIAARAAAIGLPSTTRRDLEEALFAEGVSSRSEVTTTSGRGVGLGAIRELVRSLGGTVEVQTELGRGTTFRFILPSSMLMPLSASHREPKVA